MYVQLFFHINLSIILIPPTGWIIYIVLIVVAFVLIVVFSKNIYFWLSNQLWKILLLAAVFGGGWLLGRFGGKKNGTQQGNGN